MHKGNNSEIWDKLLMELEDKLQLGLLGILQRAKSYHFETKILTLELGNEKDYSMMTKAQLEQLKLLAEEITEIQAVELKR